MKIDLKREKERDRRRASIPHCPSVQGRGYR